MAKCTVTYTAEVARRAARTYFWRRFTTPLGISSLFSIPLITGFIFVVYSVDGANWFVGAFGLLVVMNILIQGSYYFSLPRAFARRLSDPSLRTADLETLPDGIRVTSGGNSLLLKWKRFKHIWLYPDFVIFAARTPLIMGFTFLPTCGMTLDVRQDIETANRS